MVSTFGVCLRSKNQLEEQLWFPEEQTGLWCNNLSVDINPGGDHTALIIFLPIYLLPSSYKSLRRPVRVWPKPKYSGFSRNRVSAPLFRARPHRIGSGSRPWRRKWRCFRHLWDRQGRDERLTTTGIAPGLIGLLFFGSQNVLLSVGRRVLRPEQKSGRVPVSPSFGGSKWVTVVGAHYERGDAATSHGLKRHWRYAPREHLHGKADSRIVRNPKHAMAGSNIVRLDLLRGSICVTLKINFRSSPAVGDVRYCSERNETRHRHKGGCVRTSRLFIADYRLERCL